MAGCAPTPARVQTPAPTRTDPAPPSSAFGRLSGMVVRNAWVMVLVVCLAGCVTNNDDLAAYCLAQSHSDPGCCPTDTHIDHGTCCLAGMHAISDVEHPDWRVCVV